MFPFLTIPEYFSDWMLPSDVDEIVAGTVTKADGDGNFTPTEVIFKPLTGSFDLFASIVNGAKASKEALSQSPFSGITQGVLQALGITDLETDFDPIRAATDSWVSNYYGLNGDYDIFVPGNALLFSGPLAIVEASRFSVGTVDDDTTSELFERFSITQLGYGNDNHTQILGRLDTGVEIIDGDVGKDTITFADNAAQQGLFFFVEALDSEQPDGLRYDQRVRVAPVDFSTGKPSDNVNLQDLLYGFEVIQSNSGNDHLVIETMPEPTETERQDVPFQFHFGSEDAARVQNFVARQTGSQQEALQFTGGDVVDLRALGQGDRSGVTIPRELNIQGASVILGGGGGAGSSEIGEVSFDEGDDTGVQLFTIIDAEHILGTGGNDTIFGSIESNALLGYAGRDLIIGGDGDDLINGGAGSDTIIGSKAGRVDSIGSSTTDGPTDHDVIDGGEGDDIVFGGLGNDILDGGTGGETVGIGDILIYDGLTDIGLNVRRSSEGKVVVHGVSQDSASILFTDEIMGFELFRTTELVDALDLDQGLIDQGFTVFDGEVVPIAPTLEDGPRAAIERDVLDVSAISTGVTIALTDVTSILPNVPIGAPQLPGGGSGVPVPIDPGPPADPFPVVFASSSSTTDAPTIELPGGPDEATPVDFPGDFPGGFPGGLPGGFPGGSPDDAPVASTAGPPLVTTVTSGGNTVVANGFENVRLGDGQDTAYVEPGAWFLMGGEQDEIYLTGPRR